MSTKVSSASRGRGKAVLPSQNHLIGLEFEKNIPVFPFFAEVQLAFPSFMTEIHLAVELVQIVSLALLPYHNWGFALNGILRALHFSHIPLYDSNILGIPFEATLAVSAVAVAAMLFCITVAVFFVMKDEDDTSPVFGINATRFVRIIMYSFSSFLFIPLLQNFLSVAFCKPEDFEVGLFWYPDISCHSGASAFSLAVCAVGAVLLCFNAYIAGSFLYDANPMSRHYFSRAHSLLDAPMLAFKVVSCVMMHYFVSSNRMVYHAIWMAVSSLVLALAFVFLPPHYRKVTTQTRVTGLLLCTSYAILAACSHSARGRREFESNSHSDVGIVLAVFPILAWVFWRFIALARTSSIFVNAMEQLHEGHIRQNITHFPKNLPEEELLFENNAEMYADILEHASTETVNEDPAESGEYHFTFPYVDYISHEYDVELASRFLIYFRKFTLLDLTKFQLGYATSLYMKGVQAYRSSSFLRLAFANFLVYHAAKPKLALQQVQVFRTMEASISERYQGFLLHHHLSSVLHLGQSTRTEALSRAKRRHREALHHTTEFWQLLLVSDEVDKNALSNATRSILSAKEDVLRTYKLLLSKNPSHLEILACYTTFVETLLNDVDATQQCLQCLREGREARAQSNMRGAKGKQADTGTMTQIPLEFDSGSHTDETESAMRASRHLLLVTGGLLCLLGGFLAMYVVVTNRLHTDIKSTVAAGNLRGLAAQCAAAVTQLYQAVVSGADDTVSRFDLLGLQQDFAALHNELTLGTHKPSSRNLVNNLRQVPLFVRGSNFSFNLWTLGTLVSVALRDIAAHPTNSTYLDWVIHDLPADVSIALNETAVQWENAYDLTQTSLRLWTGVLVGAALVVIGIGCLVVFFNTHKIEAIRSDIFSLFSLIPRRVQRKLFRDTRKKYTELDAFFGMNTRNKLVKLIGADQNDQEKLTLQLDEKSDSRKQSHSQTESEIDSRRGSDAESVVSSNAASTTVGNKSDGHGASDRPSSSKRRRRRGGKHDGDDHESTRHRAAARGKIQFSNDAAFSVVFVRTLVVALVMLVSAIAIIAYASTLPDSYHGSLSSETHLFRTASSVAEDIDELLDAARGFVFTGHQRYFERYVVQHSAMRFDDLRRELLHAQLPPDGVVRLNQLELFHDGVIERLDIATRLASSTYEPLGNTYLQHVQFGSTFLSTFRWPQEEGLLLTQLSPYWGILDIRSGLLNGSQSDLAKPQAAQLAIAVRLISDEPFVRAVEKLTDGIRAASHVPEVIKSRTQNHDRLFSLTLAGTIISFVGLLAAGLIVSLRIKSDHLQNTASTLLLLVLTFCVAVSFALCLAALVRSADGSTTDPFPEVLDAAKRSRYAWTDAIDDELRFPRLYLANGNMLWNIKYRDVYLADFSTNVVSPLADIKRIADLDPTMVAQLDEENLRILRRMIEDVNRIKRLDEIAVVLIYSATSQNPDNWAASNAANTTFLNRIYWNITAEADYHVLRAKYQLMDQGRFYSDRDSDLAANSDAKLSLATATLFSHRCDDLYLNVRQYIRQIFDRISAAALDVQKRHALETKHFLLAAFALGIGALSAATVLGLSVFLTYSRSESAKTGKDGSVPGSSAAASGSMATEASLPYFVYGGLVVLLLAIAGVVIAQVAQEAPVAVRLNEATERTWLGARALQIAQRMHVDPSFFIEGQETAQRLYKSILDTVAALYFKQSSQYFSVAQDAKQDSLSFGRFSWYSLLSYLSDSTSTAAASGSVTGLSDSASGEGIGTPAPLSLASAFQSSENPYVCNSTRGSTYLFGIARGASLVYDSQWTTLLQRLSYAAPSDVPLIVSEMKALYQPMLLGLSMSVKQYESFELDRSKQWQAAVIALVAIALGFLLFMHFIVLRRFVEFLGAEESSARLMLRIIPQDARDSNRQIQAYLESGRVKASADDLNSAIASMSTIPVIAIDQKGIIMRFSQAAENVFGFTSSEVVGMNVKCLMPEEIAQNHDGYLSTYRRTRVKHVIDSSRRVKARKKNGDLLPIELRVLELKFGDELVFMGFAKDISGELDLGVQDQLNKYVLDMSRDPCVSIDQFGIILNVNQAVTTTFGYGKDELLRENIKMLMPSDIALNHDGYLARYRETGVKTVVDSTRQVQGQRKNGEIFQASVTVREIKQHGEPPMFVGFIVDVTEAHEAATLNEINEVISDLSPVPIIGINDKGAIIKFSKAASALFGYTKEELIGRGQNVQILVPPAYGDHSRFIKNYLQTGVAKMIGSTRNITARKRDKTIFPATLSLREIRKESMQPVFLGYMIDISQTRQLEEAGQLSAEIMRFSMMPIVVTNTSGIITSCNEAAETTFGWEKSELLGKNVKVLTPPNIQPIHDNLISNYLKSREKTVVGLNRVVQAMRKNGELFPVDLSLREVPESESGAGCFFAYLRDVTSHRETLQQFMINDCITQLSTVPIVAVNGKGIVESFSSAAEDCFGYSASEIIGENIKMLMTPEHAEKHDEYLRRYRKTGIKTIIDSTRVVTAKKRDGTTFQMEISVKEIKKEGTQTSFVGYCRDTSRDLQLEQEKELGMTIRDLSTIPIILINKIGTILYVNQAFCHEFQYKKEEILNQNIKILIPPEIAVHHDEYLASYVARGSSAAKTSTIVNKIRRLMAVRKDGSRVEVEAKVAEARSSRSDMLQFVGFLRNLGMQLLLEQANYTIDTITNLSLIPIVAIDHRGIVIKFSKAAEISFDYTAVEVLGNNVKMLMPEEIADKHDGYLRTYFKTHIKTVVGAQSRQEGRKKNGSRFPLELSIREIVKHGQNPLFIGYLRDASQDTDLERAMQLSSVVTQLCPIPIVVINRHGIVQSFNAAACEAFEYTALEVIDQDISMLMTPEDAAYHGKYLKTYAKTKIKSAIDAVKKRQAKRKSGTTFFVEVSVREIIPSSKDERQICYLGFMRDLSAVQDLQQAGIVNDTIANMSQVPLIVITNTGVVTKFSHSAEQVFGYDAKEVLNKNVKMLMPQSFADHHDEYLENYRKRGASAVDMTVEKFVRGRRRNGEEFPAKLSIREVRKQGQEPMFLGYLDDMSTKYEIIRSKLVTENSIQLCSSPIISMSPQGIVRSFNEAAEDCFGYTQKEIVGFNIKVLMPRKTAEYHDSFLANYLKTGVKHVVDRDREVTAKRKNGKRFSAIISVREVKENDDHFFVGYVRDRSNIAALEQASVVNDAVISMSSCSVIGIDINGIITRFSPAAETLFLYKAIEVLGKNVSILMPEPHRTHHNAYLENYQKTKVKKVVGKTTQNLKAVRKDGTEFNCELSVAELSLEGADSGFIALVQDVTETIARQADLEVSRLGEEMTLRPLIAIDEIGTIIRANSSVCTLFGYDQKQLLKQNIKMLMPPEFAAEHDGYLRRYRETHVKHVIDTTRRVTGRTKMGRFFDVDLQVKEITTANGSLMFLGYVDDVSQKKELAVAQSLAETMMSLVPAPLIIINNLGIITHFNSAAENVFEFEARQVIGKNVKLLMPPEIARHHDDYLTRYFKTGEKHIIDGVRAVEGETKTGKRIGLRVTVREVKKKGNEVMFVGFCQQTS